VGVAPNPSELLFERFCAKHGIAYTDIAEGVGKSVDYEININGSPIAVEIESLTDMSGWNPGGVHSRVIGQHVRRKIEDARKQIQRAAERVPAVLLIHNTVDPFLAFGTEDHDFLAAMYGDLTVRFTNGVAGDTFHGRNSMVRPHHNSSFSAIGRLEERSGDPAVLLIENAFAKRPLVYERLPSCIQVLRVEVEDAA
jgi:hypothetical protein